MYFEQKDLDRIKKLVERSCGDEQYLISLCRRMANSITDADKALRRANVCRALYEYNAADVFLDRYREL